MFYCREEELRMALLDLEKEGEVTLLTLEDIYKSADG